MARRPPAEGILPAPERRRRITDGGASVLGATLVMRGELTLAEDLIIEGCFDGRIVQDNDRHCRLSIGEHARVRADIRTGSAVIAGRMEGDVRGAGTVVVLPTAELAGKLTAEHLSVDLRAKLEDVVLSGQIAPTRFRDRRT